MRWSLSQEMWSPLGHRSISPLLLILGHQGPFLEGGCSVTAAGLPQLFFHSSPLHLCHTSQIVAPAARWANLRCI